MVCPLGAGEFGLGKVTKIWHQQFQRILKKKRLFFCRFRLYSLCTREGFFSGNLSKIIGHTLIRVFKSLYGWVMAHISSL